MSSKLAILIVDDHPAMRTTLKDILEEEGYEVNTAATGFQGLELSMKKKYDLYLLDVRLPDLNGVDVLKRMKASIKNPRTIMMTAYSMDELKTEALREGALAFLQKPLDIETVLTIIKEEENPQILIVMEDRKVRKKLGAQLKKKNYRVYISETPGDALEMARQIKFSQILIDTSLRSMSALTLFSELRAVSPHSATIIFTEPQKEYLEITAEAVKHDAYAFMEKPVNIDKLLTTMDNIKHQYRINYAQNPGNANETAFK
ncbi:MAG: response regulator [Spirochaetes bacterium]|jgi:DNA-binding NtrC family response regulator|nr:response regulator [Spirochaetota bacterium]